MSESVDATGADGANIGPESNPAEKAGAQASTEQASQDTAKIVDPFEHLEVALKRVPSDWHSMNSGPEKENIRPLANAGDRAFMAAALHDEERAHMMWDKKFGKSPDPILLKSVAAQRSHPDKPILSEMGAALREREAVFDTYKLSLENVRHGWKQLPAGEQREAGHKMQMHVEKSFITAGVIDEKRASDMWETILGKKPDDKLLARLSKEKAAGTSLRSEDLKKQFEQVVMRGTKVDQMAKVSSLQEQISTWRKSRDDALGNVKKARRRAQSEIMQPENNKDDSGIHIAKSFVSGVLSGRRLHGEDEDRKALKVAESAEAGIRGELSSLGAAAFVVEDERFNPGAAAVRGAKKIFGRGGTPSEGLTMPGYGKRTIGVSGLSMKNVAMRGNQLAAGSKKLAQGLVVAASIVNGGPGPKSADSLRTSRTAAIIAAQARSEGFGGMGR